MGPQDPGRCDEEAGLRAEGKRVEITEPSLLLVDCKDDENFVKGLLGYLGLSRTQVVRAEGKGLFAVRLAAVRRATGFDMVESLGIVRDADADPQAAFQSVCSALKYAGLAVPERPLSPAGGKPQVCVMILPDEASRGAIEDLCLRSVESDLAMPCVESYFQCLKTCFPEAPVDSAKSRVQVFLASRLEAGMSLGVAAQKGYWPWDSPVFDELKDFLRQVARQKAREGCAPSA
ncbi:MAG: hypothetical protein K6T75_05800 [Acetobacteraceae bacterium]|nr:hypothetical protein [Acetobacteraceae bacterium]